MFLSAFIHDTRPPPWVIRRPSLRRRKVWLPLADGLDCHHFGLLPLIALARPLVAIARVMTARSRRVSNILQSPLFSISYKFHERICMVSRGVSRLTTPPLFYLPCREGLLHERYIGLREQRLHQVSLLGLCDVAPREGVILEQPLIFRVLVLLVAAISDIKSCANCVGLL